MNASIAVSQQKSGREQALVGRFAKQPLGHSVEVFLGSHVPNASRAMRDPFYAIEHLQNAIRTHPMPCPSLSTSMERA